MKLQDNGQADEVVPSDMGALDTILDTILLEKSPYNGVTAT